MHSSILAEYCHRFSFSFVFFVFIVHLTFALQPMDDIAVYHPRNVIGECQKLVQNQWWKCAAEQEPSMKFCVLAVHIQFHFTFKFIHSDFGLLHTKIIANTILLNCPRWKRHTNTYVHMKTWTNKHAMPALKIIFELCVHLRHGTYTYITIALNPRILIKATSFSQEKSPALSPFHLYFSICQALSSLYMQFSTNYCSWLTTCILMAPKTTFLCIWFSLFFRPKPIKSDPRYWK